MKNETRQRNIILYMCY